MKGWMYILECADGSYYTGSTCNLTRRLWQHEHMLGANYTKLKHPVKLIYSEEFKRIDYAFYREKQVQGWSHAKKKALIDGKWKLIHEMAECKNESRFDSAQRPEQDGDQRPRSDSAQQQKSDSAQ